MIKNNYFNFFLLFTSFFILFLQPKDTDDDITSITGLLKTPQLLPEIKNCRDYFPGFTIAESILKLSNNDKAEARSILASILFDRSDNADKNTQDVLNFNQEFLQHRIDCGCYSQILPYYMKSRDEDFSPIYDRYKSQYPNLNHFSSEVFLYDHGLQFLPDKVKDYLKQRDILDIGAFEGDSMIVLQNYTDQHIYGYEPVTKNHKALIQNIYTWKFNKTKNHYFNLGLGEKKENMYISDLSGTGGAVNNYGRGKRIPIDTIDSQARKHNIKLGLIKADTEGYTWNIINGGLKTIKRDRPIFCIHLYHNFDEYYKIPQYIDSLGNYKFYYRADNNNAYAMSETAIIAYPAEVLYPVYS